MHVLTVHPPVPCYRRCHQMAVLPTNEKLLMVEGDDEAWVDTHHGLSASHDATCPASCVHTSCNPLSAHSHGAYCGQASGDDAGCCT